MMLDVQCLDLHQHRDDSAGRHAVRPDAVLQLVRRLAKAAGAHLLETDRATEEVVVLAATSGDLPVPTRAFLRTALGDDPAMMFDPAHFGWAAAVTGGGASLVVRLADRESARVLLALHFGEPKAAVRARVEELVPELVALLKLKADFDTRTRELEQRYATVAAALDDGECGLIAVRADHTVVFANAAASALLAKDGGLHVVRGALRPTHYPDVGRFQAALDAVAGPAPSPAAGRRRALVMMLTAEGKRRPKIVAITPADRTGRAAVEGTAAALIHVLDPGNRQPPGIETLCRLHGLSRVEGRLVCHLCAGLTVSEAAAEMRIKIETARAYLKQAFGKTATHRQAELVTLLNRYLQAVRGDFDFQSA